MTKEDSIRIEHALQALTWADQILEDVDESKHINDNNKAAPWEVASVRVMEAMCLLIDSLNGVETVISPWREEVSVAETIQPYTYLSARYAEIADRYIHHAAGLEDILRDDDDE